MAALLALAFLLDPARDLERVVERLARDPRRQREREEAIDALGALGTLAAARALEAALEDPYPHVRDAALLALARMRDAKARGEVVAFLGDALARRRAPATRRALATALGRIGDRAAVPRLLAVLVGERDPDVLAATAAALAALGDERATEPLLRRAAQVPAGRAACLRALGTFPNTAEACRAWANDPRDDVRAAVIDVEVAWRRPVLPEREEATEVGVQEGVALAEALPATSPRDLALRRASWLLEHPSWRVRSAAIAAVVALRDPSLVADLADRLDAETGRLRHEVWEALRALTGRDLPLDATAWRRAPPVAELPPPRPADPAPFSGFAYFGIPVRSERVAFLFDASDGAREAMEAARAQLSAAPPSLRFDLLVHEAPWEHPPRSHVSRAFGRLDAGRVEEAGAWLVQRKPAGACAPFDALAAALDDEEADTVYIVSAGTPERGAVTRPARVLEALAERNRFRRVVAHAVFAGGAESGRRLLRDVAAATGGLAADLSGRRLE